MGAVHPTENGKTQVRFELYHDLFLSFLELLILYLIERENAVLTTVFVVCSDVPLSHQMRAQLAGEIPLNHLLATEAAEKNGSIYLHGAACFVKDRSQDVGGKKNITRDIQRTR